MSTKGRKKKAWSPPTSGYGSGPNAPRLPAKAISWFKKESEEFSNEYRELSRDLGVCYDLVKLAGHVLKRPVLLKVGTQIQNAATDGKTIFLPKLHPQRRIAVKHEISHLYFKSNIALRLLFVKDLVVQVEREFGTTLHSLQKEKLISDTCFIINVFDDLRVNSLWGLLYPGDGRDMQEWYHDDVAPRMLVKANETYPDGDISHLMTYIILVSMGQPAKSTLWGQFKDDIEIAAGNVCYKTFNACLLIVKGLLLKILRKHFEDAQKDTNPQPPSPQTPPNPTDRPDDDPELRDAQDAAGDQTPDPDLDDLMKDKLKKSDAGKEILAKIIEARSPGQEFKDDNAGFDYQRTAPLRGDDMEAADILCKIDTQDLDQILPEMENDAIDDVAEIQRALAEQDNIAPGRSYRNEGEWLKKSAKFRLNLHYIKEKDVKPALFSREDMEVALRWKRFFQRILGTLSQRTDETGYDLVTDLYIQQKISKEPLDCFRVDSKGRGFRINLCLDMSGSMQGSRFATVERLARTLQIALDFPFVRLGIWGFNSRSHGDVDLYKFPKSATGFTSDVAQVSGATPLPQAIQIVGRDLTAGRDDSHLFVLTDGDPVYTADNSKEIARTILVNWTQDAVRELRDQKVMTYCFMIDFSPRKSEMNKMFGSDWREVRENQVYHDAFELIKSKFIRFLRGR